MRFGDSVAWLVVERCTVMVAVEPDAENLGHNLWWEDQQDPGLGHRGLIGAENTGKSDLSRELAMERWDHGWLTALLLCSRLLY